MLKLDVFPPEVNTSLELAFDDEGSLGASCRARRSL
jgi:hypothetical protein